MCNKLEVGLNVPCSSLKAYNFYSLPNNNQRFSQTDIRGGSFIETLCLRQFNGFKCGLQVLVNENIIMHNYCCKPKELSIKTDTGKLFEQFSKEESIKCLNN